MYGRADKLGYLCQSMEKYYIFYVLALVAEILGTISGFGSSILFVPLAAFFFEFKTVLGITAVFHVFSNLSKIYLFRTGLDKNIARRLGIPAVVAVIAGALLTELVPQQELELTMCVVLIGLSIYLIIFSNKKIEPTNTNLITGGLTSGFLAGLIGSGGAIRGLTLTAFQLEKNIFLATSAMIDLGVDASRTVVYYANGYMVKELSFLIPFLLGISFVGSWLGKKLLAYIPQAKFKLLVLSIIMLTSLIQVVRYLL
jgi:uncharacterized protein